MIQVDDVSQEYDRYVRRAEPLPATTGDLPTLQDPGVYAAPSPSVEELRKLPPIRRARLAHSLHELQADYAFFTHALLFLEGGFQHDPIEEWMLLNNRVGSVFGLKFEHRIFRGHRRPRIGDYYDRLLLGCDRETWGLLRPWLNGLTGADSTRKKYVSAFVHEAVLWDPKVWRPGQKTPSEVSKLVVYPVGVSSTHGLYYLDTFPGLLPHPPGSDLPRLPKRPEDYVPVVRRLDPEAATLQTAAALFGPS